MALTLGRAEIIREAGTTSPRALADRSHRSTRWHGSPRVSPRRAPHEIGLAELVPKWSRTGSCSAWLGIGSAPPESVLLLLEPGLGKRIEIVAVAHINECLAAIVDLFQLAEHRVCRRKGDVRPMPHLRGALRASRRGDNVPGPQRGARNLADPVVEPLAIVGEIYRERRRPGRDDGRTCPPRG